MGTVQRYYVTVQRYYVADMLSMLFRALNGTMKIYTSMRK